MTQLHEEKLSINSYLPNYSKFVCEYSVALAAGLAKDCVTFGSDRAATIRLRDMEGDRATYESAHGEWVARVPGGGEHRGLTLAAVVAALLTAEQSIEPALELAPGLVPAGRGDERLVERGDGRRVVVVNDSYNANPASMAAALADLAARSGPRYAVLGDMGELGADSATYHRALAEQCAALDGVFCVGSEMRRTFDGLPDSVRLGHAMNAAEVDLAILADQLPDAARVLIKGSNAVFWQADWCSRLIRALET